MDTDWHDGPRRACVGARPRLWRSIAGTDDDPLYQSAREGMRCYRFEDLADGTYLVELDFAEIDRNARAGKRGFDVAIDGRRSDLTVTFDRERGSPLISAIRVTERPDRTGAGSSVLTRLEVA